MARRQFTIELKVDFNSDDDPRYAPMKQIVLQFARELHASAIMLSGENKQPEVVCFTEDSFFDTEELQVVTTDPSAAETSPADADADAADAPAPAR